MFSLIISIISIALVAALALATIYYGGAGFNKSSDIATATKFLTQSNQILGADRLYRVDHEGAAPSTMQDLISGGYLTSIPSIAASNSNFSAVAQTQETWQLLKIGNAVAYLNTSLSLTEEVCRKINKSTVGQDGVLKIVNSLFYTQCYGPSESALTVVVLADPTNLSSLAPSLPYTPQIGGSALTASDWTLAPRVNTVPTPNPEPPTPPTNPLQTIGVNTAVQLTEVISTAALQVNYSNASSSPTLLSVQSTVSGYSAQFTSWNCYHAQDYNAGGCGLQLKIDIDPSISENYCSIGVIKVTTSFGVLNYPFKIRKHSYQAYDPNQICTNFELD